VECIKGTREVDKDEIFISAVLVTGERSKRGKGSQAGSAQAGEIVDFGKFRKGDKKKYARGKRVARFALGGAALSWPRYFPVSLLMIEKDEGALGKIVEAAVDAVDDQVVKAVTAAASSVAGAALTAGAALGSAVPLVGTAVGAAVGAAVSLGLAAIKNGRADELFEPKSLEWKLSSPPAENQTRDATVSFEGFGGKYRVNLTWSVR
jgi:hypothetical protein